MGKLRYFNKSEYNGLGDLLADIRKELEALQPNDSADIVWSKSANGISAKLKKFSAGSETGESNEDDTVQEGSTEYTGDFAVTKTAENTYTMRDGYTDIAGSISSKTFNIPATGKHYIVFDGVYDNAIDKYSVDIKVNTSEKGHYIIARIIDGALEQVWKGNAIYFSERFFV